MVLVFLVNQAADHFLGNIFGRRPKQLLQMFVCELLDYGVLLEDASRVAWLELFGRIALLFQHVLD